MEKKNNERLRGRGGGRKSQCQPRTSHSCAGSGEWWEGPPGSVCWALPASPKQRGWQGGGHCHILSASGSRRAWHGAQRGGGGLLPGISSLLCRGRAGATQAPNGFQAPMLKAGVGSRLSSCCPSQWPDPVPPGGWGRREGSKGERGALDSPPAFPLVSPMSPGGCVCTRGGRYGGPKVGFLWKPTPQHTRNPAPRVDSGQPDPA